MDGYIVHGAIEMARGGLACIQDGRGMLVDVWDGELWITQDGDRRDYFIAPGASLLLERDGRTVIYALKPSRLTLTAPVPAYYAKRITLTLPGTATPRVLYDRSKETSGWLAGIGHRLTRLWTNSYARYSNPTTAGF